MKTFYLTFLLTIVTGSIVFAQATKPESTAKPVKSAGQNYTPGNFIDKDNNGICDNFESRGSKGQGGNFVDADGDGICDRRAGKGYQQGKRGPYCQQGCRRATNPPCRGVRSK